MKPPPKKVCAIRGIFPLRGGVNSHKPGKILNKKYMHNPGLRGTGVFFIFFVYLKDLIWTKETIQNKKNYVLICY